MSNFHLARQTAESPVVRWIATFLWTILTSYLMVWPSQGTPVGSLSLFFGGSELTDAIGHVILCGILVWLWYWALSGVPLQPSRAITVAIAVGLGLGVVTELTQAFVPSRGASVFDLLADISGIGLSVGSIVAGQRLGNGD